MEVLLGTSDTDREEGELEREDGEIVDDLEDISDISIPSCGKSDYSQDLLRAISLSSISDSEGAREHNGKKFLPARKKRKEKTSYHRCKRKRKRSDIFSSYPYRSKRHRSSSSSTSSSDTTKLDKRTLRQLKEAVRINVSHDLHHNSLRTRLKAMIEPDEEDVEALRTLALLTNKSENNSNNEDNKTDTNEKADNNDETLDKELAELRLEALKSAVIKKHNERKKRKLEQIAISDNNIINDKENAENNIILENSNKNDVEEKPEDTSNEDDIDVMRAMLLASMSTKITSNKTSIVNLKSLSTSTPVALNSKRPIPTKPLIKSKTSLVKKIPIKMPSVKPLIINLNSDSESDEKISSPKQPESNPIDKSVTEFLRKQREEFEAKQAELEKSDKKLLDKSVLKLLSKSQQTEYQLLKQKILLANRKRKVRRISSKSVKNGVDVQEKPKPPKKIQRELRMEMDGRLQMKGKYKELAPLIQKVNLANSRHMQLEERIKKLLELLHRAREDHANAHQVYTQLVQKLSQAKDNIDTRLYKLANGNKVTSTIPIRTKPTITPTVTPKDTPEIVVVQENNVTESAIDDNQPQQPDNKAEISEPKYPDYVSPLDNNRNNSKNTTSNNPLQMLCPYELFGVCKDQDCTFNHCP